MSNSEARGQAAGAAAPPPAAGSPAGVRPAPAARQPGGPGQPGGLGQPGGPGQPGGSGRRRRWVAAIVVVVVVAAGIGAAAAAGAFSRSGGTGASTASSGYRTSTAVVTRRSLTSQTQVDATLGDAGTWSVVVPSASSSGSSSAGSSSSSSAGGSSSGTFTWLPTVGHTVRQGQVIYRVSGSPVVLLYGNVPSYRDLSEGLTGADVRELNTGLVKLGYTTRAALGPRSGWDYYSAATAYAVELLQSKLGLTVTGTLSLGQAAFLPGPALITALGSSTALGGPATPGSVVAERVLDHPGGDHRPGCRPAVRGQGRRPGQHHAARRQRHPRGDLADQPGSQLVVIGQHRLRFQLPELGELRLRLGLG